MKTKENKTKQKKTKQKKTKQNKTKQNKTSHFKFVHQNTTTLVVYINRQRLFIPRRLDYM